MSNGFAQPIFSQPFMSLEQGVGDYVTRYLATQDPYR